MIELEILGVQWNILEGSEYADVKFPENIFVPKDKALDKDYIRLELEEQAEYDWNDDHWVVEVEDVDYALAQKHENLDINVFQTFFDDEDDIYWQARILLERFENSKHKDITFFTEIYHSLIRLKSLIIRKHIFDSQILIETLETIKDSKNLIPKTRTHSVLHNWRKEVMEFAERHLFGKKYSDIDEGLKTEVLVSVDEIFADLVVRNLSNK